MNKVEWMPWELYLIWLGERLNDYSYTKEMVYDNIEYFHNGYVNHISPYYLLEMFSYELEEKL